MHEKSRLPTQTGFWWELVDSNHRSITQQIYSLSPLATRESSHIHFCALRGVPPRECLLIIADTLRKCKPFFQIFLLFSAARALRGRPPAGHAPAGAQQKGGPAKAEEAQGRCGFAAQAAKPAKHRKIAKTGRWQRSQRPVWVRFCGKGTLGVRRQRGCPVLLPAYAGRAARRDGGQPPVWGWWYTKPPSSLSSV